MRRKKTVCSEKEKKTQYSIACVIDITVVRIDDINRYVTGFEPCAEYSCMPRNINLRLIVEELVDLKLQANSSDTDNIVNLRSQYCTRTSVVDCL